MDGSSRPDDPRHEAATASIRQLRTGLLDLTGRNPLISYPHATRTGARAHVRAVHTPMNVLFAQLAEGKTLSIRPLPEPEDEPEDERTDQFRAMLEMTRATDAAYVAAFAALTEDELTSPQAARVERALRDAAREALGLPPWQAAQATGLAEHAARCGINPSYELPPAAPEEPGRAAPAELQTLMPPDALERALSRIRDTARTVAEETGVGTLHLAFGFLEWFESDSAEKPFVSPLLLLRVDIDRRIVRSRYQYVLTGTGDEAEVNRTLAERLDRDFRIQLPLPTEDELPEAYLARVAEEVCQGRKRWAVRRYVTLAHFPFARLAMFHDLDETAWAEAGGLASRPLLLRLLGGGASGGALFAEEHEIDAPSVADRVPALVLDADASQHSAVYDVMTGQNLVIEGPPGTGKSQTITNIIAAALADGKTVLFVADKQAALQVVKDRLDKVGLGDFCLELHSGKARKKDVLDGLAQRLAHLPAAPGPEALEARLRDLAATRAALTRYVEILNAPLGTTGGTVHDALWADRRRRDGESEAARRLDALDLPGADTLTRSDIERRRAVLERFERAAAPILAQFGAPAAHPWHGVTRADLSSVDFDPAVRETADAAAAMEAVVRAAAALAPLGIERPGLCPGPAGALRPQTP
ncbi:MAG TPA: DUF4011 domain-containing protein, partial [Acetobacteraceae bacterium]|nr:DUF4011 domain-containing protein [Acetobacteraceae bacterium]